MPLSPAAQASRDKVTNKAASQPATAYGTTPAGPSNMPKPMTSAESEEAAKQKLLADIEAGKAEAAKTFTPGVLGTINDEYRAQQDELLKTMGSRIEGMTPAELQAARTQAALDIGRQLNTNIGRGASLAAAQGIRGGAAMGLQQQAMNQALAQQGDFARKLTLDNINQRNIATDAYQRALSGQQATTLNVNTANNALRNQEFFGRTAMPFQLASLMGSARSEGKADFLNQQGIDLAKQMLDQAKQSSVPSEDLSTIKDNYEKIIDAQKKSPGQVNDAWASAGFGGDVHQQNVQAYLTNQASRMAQIVEAEMPNATSSQKAAELNTRMAKMFKDAGMPPPQVDGNTWESIKGYAPQGGIDGDPNTVKIICTESYNQGLHDASLKQASDAYRKVKSNTEQRHYIMWARRVIPVMRRSPLVARLFARAARGVLLCVNADHGLQKPLPVPGVLDRLFFAGYRGLNALSGFYHSWKIAHAKG